MTITCILGLAIQVYAAVGIGMVTGMGLSGWERADLRVLLALERLTEGVCIVCVSGT